MIQTSIIRDYCLIRDHRVVLGDELLFAGDSSMPVASFLAEFYKHAGMHYPKFHKMDNLCKLGFLAAELLLRDKNLHQSYSPDKTGIILCNASSSLDTDRNHQQTINDRTAYYPSPSVFVYTLANIVIGEICIRHKIYGEGTFFIEEKFNPERLHGYVRYLLENELVDCCITGWLELVGEQYEAVLYFVEKSQVHTNGFAIFGPEKLNEIYSRRR